jgi:hypothetical protein
MLVLKKGDNTVKTLQNKDIWLERDLFVQKEDLQPFYS